MKELKVTSLKGGMIVAKPIIGAGGVQLFSEGAVLDRKKIEMLLKRDIQSVHILDETSIRKPNSKEESVSGKIVFTGDTIVTGDVTDDSDIEIEGTLKIDGKILAAKISVKNGDLIVKGIDGAGKADINVEGKVRTEYVLDSKLNAKKDVAVADLVSRSKVTSAGNVVVHSDDLKGLVLKSEINTDGKVLVDNLGMKHETGQTVVRIKDKEKRRFFEQILFFEKTLEENKVQAERLKKIVDVVKAIGKNIKHLPTEKQNFLVINAKKYLEITKQVEEIKVLLEKSKKQIATLNKEKRYFLRVLNDIFPGVVVEIDGSRLEVKEKAKNVAFYKKGIIIMENMKK